MKKILSLLALAIVAVQFSFAADVIKTSTNCRFLRGILSIVISQSLRLFRLRLIRI
jgi:hypothetical protein